MIWFTSDHHFGHKNIIKYCNRPYSSIEEMNDSLISNWNSKVKKNDTIYYLGDFTLGNSATKYYDLLNGSISFLPGGHDHRWLSHEVGFDGVLDAKHRVTPALLILTGLIKANLKQPITMCHYPLLSWEQSHYGSIHLHGHSHGTLGIITNSGDTRIHPEAGGKHGKRMDVGIDAQNYFPTSIDEVIERLE